VSAGIFIQRQPASYVRRMTDAERFDQTPAIAALVAAWARAWNAHDMRAAAALVDAEVDFVTVAGHWLKGRAEFLEHHERIHRRHLRNSIWITRAYRVRPLPGGLVLTHLEWVITGEDADGATRPARPGTFTWVVTAAQPDWVIVAAHNTNLRSDVAHRLAPRGSIPCA
jgi:uncharacterized protein (TIGR02246 family)